MFGTSRCWGGELWSSGSEGNSRACVANVNGGRSIKFAAS